MGCLPLPVLFVLGFLAGRYFGGDQGALWGAGIGLAAGLLLAGLFIVVVRRRH
jgi:LPXTG-motif cell wall-anchored protein